MVCFLVGDLILNKELSLRSYQQVCFEGLGGYRISVLSQCHSAFFFFFFKAQLHHDFIFLFIYSTTYRGFL